MTSAPPRHVRSLVGVRGVAAAAVLLHHCLLLLPALATAYDDPGAVGSGAAAWLTLTPLHVTWAGVEAVRVFFVLSGFVLVLPFLDGRTPDWRRWYPQRLARLYLPVWGALLLALALFVLVPRGSPPGASPWLASHDVELGVWEVLAPTVLVVGDVGPLLTPLWSLQWEVVFSLLFPVYLWVGTRVRRWPLAQAGVLLLVAVAGQATGVEALRYLPLFGLGVLLAVHQDRLARLAGAAGRAPVAWAVATALVLCAVPAQRYRYALGLDEVGGLVDRGAAAATYAVSVLGCAGVIALALWSTAARRWLERPALQWLGTRSFALYLTHECVVVTLATLLGVDLQGLAVACSLVASLVVAEVFFRLAERPSHRLARRIGRPGAPTAPVTVGPAQPES